MKRPFTIYSNQHIKAIVKQDNKQYVYDGYLNVYSELTRAYLAKRFTTKPEVWPKAYIIDETPKMASSLETQQLPFMKYMLSTDQMGRQRDMKDITPQFVMSSLLEPDHKEFLDQVCAKTVLNGDQVQMGQQMVEDLNRKKLVGLHRTFFFGDELSGFDRMVEFSYLNEKNDKLGRYHQSNKNARYKCQMLYSDLRRLNGIHNNILRDLEYYDDLRQIYEPLDNEDIRQNYLESMKLDENKKFDFFGLMTKMMLNKAFGENINRYSRWAGSVFLRILDHIRSIEFTHLLNLPTDFHIEYSILNLHIWMILRRLEKIPGRQSELMRRCLQDAFQAYSKMEVNKIHLKKKNDFVKDLNYFAELNRQNYERHFYRNQKTRENNYYKIDSLVWSTIFYEKVERYSDSVYMVSEYFVKHFKYLNSLSLEDIERGQLDFDVYRNSLDFKEKIQAINPPLSEEEFEAELNNSNLIKKFFYNYDDPELVMPIDEERKQLINHRFDNVKLSVYKSLKKFETPDTYDYFNEKEEIEEKAVNRASKTVWNKYKDQDLLNFLDEKYDRTKAYTPN